MNRSLLQEIKQLERKYCTQYTLYKNKPFGDCRPETGFVNSHLFPKQAPHRRKRK